MSIKKLYTAHSIVNGFRGKNEVCFNWFVQSRKYKINLPPSDKLITDKTVVYEWMYVEQFIHECFTGEEINALQDYLKAYYDTELVIKEIPLPMAPEERYEPSTDNSPIQKVLFYWYPHGGVPTGGRTGRFNLYETDGYNLPFSVVAYYDLRFCPDSENSNETNDSSKSGHYTKEIVETTSEIPSDTNPVE